MIEVFRSDAEYVIFYLINLMFSTYQIFMDMMHWLFFSNLVTQLF
jgi:hypothetical protein